jgi:hypothetical protein
VKATDLVLKWLLSEAHLSNVPKINGRYRRCASQEGNALAVCSRLGLAEDPRVVKLAESLVEYYRATGDKNSLKTAENAAEFFLKHRLFRSCHTGLDRQPETFHSRTFRVVHLFTQLHYPLYWHCDILQELTILSRAGKLDDPRTKEALDIVEKKRGPDGLWHADDYYWNMRRTPTTKSKVLVSNVEVVDWGRKGPNKMITLNALRTLKTARRTRITTRRIRSLS